MQWRRRFAQSTVNAKLTALLLLAGAHGAHGAQAQSSQTLKIPDTAPRELDPRLRLHEAPPMPEANRRLLAAQQEKRRQLIVWAANELVTLSERADHAALAPPGDAANADLAANVDKIESLAKNLALALKAK